MGFSTLSYFPITYNLMHRNEKILLRRIFSADCKFFNSHKKLRLGGGSFGEKGGGSDFCTRRSKILL